MTYSVEYFPDNIMSIVDYFDDNFIGRPMHWIRRKPKFEPKLWNLYDTAVHGLAHTNNRMEGRHNLVGGHHVSI